MANQFFQNTGKVYMKHFSPVILDCNFIVDSTNGNGLGIRSLKGGGIQNVFMHTSSTPGVGNAGVTNPNPAAGYIAAQLTDNYNRYFYGGFGFVSAVSGTPILVIASGAAMTIGQLYTIVTVGTSTAADWVALGVPVGVTAAVGVSFIAAATGAGTGSGAVEVPKATGSGISHIEAVGDPNTTLAPLVPGIGAVGAWIFSQCLGATASGTTTLVATAPANGTVISLQFVLSNSTAA